MRERRVRSDVPAATGSGSIREDDDETVLVGKGGVRRAGEVSLGSTRAVVHRDDERRRAG